MRGRGTRDLPPPLAARGRQSAIDHDAVLLGREFERQAAGMGLLAHHQRRRRTGVHQHQGAGALQALIAGMGSVRERSAAGVVIGQNGGDEVGGRRPHAVEEREIAVAVTEEAQHRHHAVDGIEQCRRRCDVARGERGAQREQVDQQFDEGAGIAADVAAVGQDLSRQLVREPLGGGADVALLARHAQCRVAERDRGLEARHPVARFRHGVAQVADLARQAAQEAAIEMHLGIVEHEGRLAEPRDDAASDHVGTPGNGILGAVERDPLVDQRAGIGAGDAGFRRAQVAQPAEAQERDRPVFGRRGDLERRTRIADDDLARKDEAAGIDFAGAGRVARAQVLGRDDDAVGFAERKRPVDDRMRRDAASEPSNEPTRQEHGQSGTFRDRNARHRGAGSLLAVFLVPRT